MNSLHYRIKWFPQGISMVLLAFGVDFFQGFSLLFSVIPVAGTAMSMVFSWIAALLLYILMEVWFKISGHSARDARFVRLVMLLELIPILNYLPALAGYTWLTIHAMRRRDRTQYRLKRKREKTEKEKRGRIQESMYAVQQQEEPLQTI